MKKKNATKRKRGAAVRSSDWLDAIVCGDCLNEMPKMPAQSVDAIISDLPYGTTACKWDSALPFGALWSEWNRLLKPSGVVVLTASQPFTSALVMSNPKNFRHEWIWLKNKGSNFQGLKRAPFKEHESVCVFSRVAPTFNPIKQDRTASGANRITYKMAVNRGMNPITGLETATQQQTPMRHPSSVQKFNCEMGLHPTQKPLTLMRYLVRTYTNPGDVILDPCCGSGTTCLAAMQEGRHYVGIEKEHHYADASRQRITEARGMASNEKVSDASDAFAAPLG